jgi:hypothetical protein
MSKLVQSVVSAYEQFVKSNAGWLVPLEETARVSFPFLPAPSVK